jgi:hypothetical protein
VSFSAKFSLAESGFTLAYFAVMGILVVNVMPLFVGRAGLVSLYVLLPAGLLGAALFHYGRSAMGADAVEPENRQ